MSWFSHHAVLFALLCAGAAVLYGLGLTKWILDRPAGTDRLQETARAVQARADVRTAEAARSGLAPALGVAFRAGSVTGLLVVGLGLFGVAGYYWALTDW